jgi:hypothetical protein
VAHFRSAILALAMSGSLWACTSADTADIGLVVRDAAADSGARDALAALDAAEPDAGAPLDAAEPDAAQPDAAEPDATEPDAGEPDAGAQLDAAELSDAGTATAADGSAADVGSFPDAAELPDAGETPDAGESLDGALPDGCVVGQVASTATTSQLDLFGTPAYFNGGQPLPAGSYRITYLDGCMKYGGAQGWTVNAYAANRACWYVIGATTNDRIVVPPGTIGYAVGSGAYANFEDCVTASRQVPPVDFQLLQPSVLGVWLLDSPYSDNLPGLDNRNPTWQLSTLTSSCSQ